MKRRLVWGVAILSGLVLLVPDPVPFIDEGLALLVFMKSMAYLGHDVSRWVPFLRKGRAKSPEVKGAAGQTIDV